MSVARILDADQVLTTTPDWGIAALEHLESEILNADNPFPCTFAVTALKRGELRFGFYDLTDRRTAMDSLARSLTEFVETHQSIGSRTSLICMFHTGVGQHSMAYYFQQFWTVLRDLRLRDDRPWPTDIPIDPDTSNWEFCFHGEPIFVVCATPAHKNRASRQSPWLTITFQPRSVFDGLEPESLHGKQSRAAIRKRLKAFDAVDVAPELQSYGEGDCREWRQYFLPDTNDAANICPFSPED